MIFEVMIPACTPTRATKYSAMVDLYAREEVSIKAGETKIIPLGIKIDFEALKKSVLEHRYFKGAMETLHPVPLNKYFEQFLKTHYIDLQPRSSIRNKGLIFEGVACIEEDGGIVKKGVVDLDYKKEIGLILHNPLRDFSICYDPLKSHRGDIIKIEKNKPYVIALGDKIAQCTIVEHKGDIMGIESEEERMDGFGSTGN